MAEAGRGEAGQEPACWSWPTVEAAKDDLAALVAWHEGRCALCGGVRVLVRDHCHYSGFIRGLLCPSCNSREGRPGAATRTPVVHRYRVRPPAFILGVIVAYSGNRRIATPGRVFAGMALPPPNPRRKVA